VVLIAIIIALTAFVTGLLALLPELPQPGSVEGPLGTALSYAYAFDQFIPVTEMVAVIAGFLAVLVGLQAYTVARKVISHYTGGGGA